MNVKEFEALFDEVNDRHPRSCEYAEDGRYVWPAMVKDLYESMIKALTIQVHDVEEFYREGEDELFEWPCQMLHGGRGSALYFNTNGMCQHPECHPKNDDRR